MDTVSVLRKEPIYPSSQPENHQIVTVMLVDDYQRIRQALKMVIDDEDDLQVIAEACNGKEAIEVARKTQPDIIVMDITMPVMDGIEATRAISAESPDMPIVGLSLHTRVKVIERMLDAGASAYLLKDDAFDTLCTTIRSEVTLAKE